VLDLGRDGRGSGKAVVFTESITTQEYLRKLLLGVGLADGEITLFRGTNDGTRVQQAHARWLEEEGSKLAPGSRPTREVAVRLALVHETSQAMLTLMLVHTRSRFAPSSCRKVESSPPGISRL
jgi:hypothetical protein